MNLLSALTNLTDLSLAINQIIDVSPLAGLTNLTTLRLTSNRIIDVSPLTSLTNLTVLELFSNQIRDVSPLVGLTNLTELLLNDNQISNVSRSQTERNACYEGILHISANSIDRKSRAINQHSRATRDLSAFKE